MSIDDLKLKMTLVQIELAELRQIIQAKEDTFKALEWQCHELTQDGTHENTIKIIDEKRTWVFNPHTGIEEFMTDADLAIAEKIYDELLKYKVKEIISDETTHEQYIAQVEKEEALEIAAAAAQECLLDPIVDIESEENEKESIESEENEKESIESEENVDVKIQSLNIEPLSVDALSIMAIKYYKKTGEAVTDIIEERFNVKSLHKLNDFQNCTLQLILMGDTWNQ
jgi:hypothetical protein